MEAGDGLRCSICFCRDNRKRFCRANWLCGMRPSRQPLALQKQNCADARRLSLQRRPRNPLRQAPDGSVQIEPSRADTEWIPHPAQFIEKGRSINGLPQRRGIQTNGSPWRARRPPFPTSPVKFAAHGAGRTDAALRLPVVFETAKTPPQSPAANAGWFRANRAVQGG